MSEPYCEAEMCPFWTGDGCVCVVMGLEDGDRDNLRRDIGINSDGEWIR